MKKKNFMYIGFAMIALGFVLFSSSASSSNGGYTTFSTTYYVPSCCSGNGGNGVPYYTTTEFGLNTYVTTSTALNGQVYTTTNVYCNPGHACPLSVIPGNFSPIDSSILGIIFMAAGAAFVLRGWRK